MASLIGKLVAGRYLVNSLVASGGMASVYLAKDKVLEREVALKIIHPHLVGDKSFLEKFRREAKVAAKLSHPNLVNVFDQGSDQDITYLVMEYVPGITLRDALNDHGPLEPARAMEIIEPLTDALSAAHQAGILHRDLKPENVLLSDDGKVKLGDFGLARSITQHTQTGSVVGTVAYLSPELVLRGAADARSDIYSLGVMIFELLTGKQPYEGDQAVQIAYQHANDNVPAPSKVNPAVPELLDEIVLWATARNPAHRPTNATALLPVISRARQDLAKGRTSTLQEITKTMKFDFREASGSGGQTEVLDFEDQPLLGDRSTNAVKLEKRSKRGTFAISLLTVLAIFGGAGSGWWFSQGPGGFASVPNLEGRELAAAVEIFEPLGVDVVSENENSGLIPAGFITRTEPPAGSTISKNSVITVFVSIGPKQVRVPDFRGLSLEQVTKLLLESGLQPGEVRYFFQNEAEGIVFGLSKAVGAAIDQDSQVDLSVSLGPLPDLAGLTEEEALALLEGLDVSITGSVEIFDNQIPKGQVIGIALEQEPLPQGGQLSLEISKGSEIVIMPNVVGETIAAAKTLLEQLGFRVIIDTNQLSSNFGIAKVKNQSPKAQSQLRYGDTVTIISR